MKKYIIILTGLVVFGGFVYQNRSSQMFGAFGDPFISIQLASSPANGECLTTDGTNNDWATCGGGSADGYGFTTDAYGGVTVQSTTTALWLKALTPYSLLASTTLFNYSSTTYASSATASSTLGLFGNIGVGKTVPTFSIDVSRPGGAGTGVNAMRLVNVGDTGSGGGAGVQVYTGTLPTASGDRLGYNLFGYTDGTTNRNSAGLFGYANQAWTAGTNQGSYLTFETTPDNSATRAERMRINANGNVSFAFSSSTNYSSFITASTTNLFVGLDDGCLNIASGLVGSTGSACGSGSGGGIHNPFTNTAVTVPNLGVKYTSATTSALNINSYATTTIGNLHGVMWVPSDYATNGCAGDATKTDFGACVNALYSLASTSGTYHAKVRVPLMKVPSGNWTTAINANINGLALNLECESSQLIWGGTGTSTVINHGNPTGHLVSEISGCVFQGNSSLIAAAQTNTKTTGGIFFGGSNGAVHVNFHDNSVNGFGQNIAWGGANGAHSYMITLRNNAISGGNGNIQGNMVYVGVANDSGERNVLDGNSFTDPSDNIATSSIYFADGGTASNFITNNSIDNAGMYLGTSNGMFYIAGNHFENPGAPAGYTQYIPMVNPSSDGSTMITLIGNEFANSASNRTWETIIKHGGQLYASGNRIDNYNGFTVTNFSDHSNNNGQSSDHICQTQVQGGTLTNLIAGGGGIAWSLTNGVPCTINRANSYSIGMRPLSTNVNQIYSGSSIVADFDHSGNWSLGEAVSTSLVTVKTRLTAQTSIGAATSTLTYPLESYSATAPQFGLSAGAGIAKWTLRNAGGSFFISSTTVAGTATTSTSAFSILNTGEVIIRNIFQIFSVAGTKLMDVAANVVTLLGTWDFSGATVKEHTYSSFSYATSTAWNATTTIPLGPAYTAESWTGVKCFTDTGTLNVSFNDGTNRMDIVNASTTVGSFLFSTNNTFTASEKRYVDVGTPSSSPTKIACTIDKIVNN